MTPRIAFLFRKGRRERISDGGPREFTYGFTDLASAGAPVEMIDEGDLGLDKPVHRFVDRLANFISGVFRVHPRVVSALIKARNRLNEFAFIVATTHSFGLALALVYRLGIVRAKPMMMTMGLFNRRVGPISLTWLRWLLQETVLMTLSKAEASDLRKRLGPTIEVADFVFGVDLEFWTPGTDRENSDEVLSVGNDWNRDFATLVAAWRPEFPKLTIITSLPIKALKPNVTVVRGDWRSQEISDVDLRARVRKARLIVVPLRDTIQPSGQSAAMQAFACERPVVLTKNRGLWDLAQIERHNAAVLVPPGDALALGAAIDRLLCDPEHAEAMGRRARRMLVDEDVSSASMSYQIAELCSRRA